MTERFNFVRVARVVVVAVSLCLTVDGISAQEKGERSREETAKLKQAVIESFEATHDGWSADELLIRDDLRDAFVAACQKAYPDGEEAEFNWALLNLRKANKLTVKSTKRTRGDDSAYRHAAEIAARSLHDRDGISFDRIVTDPKLRAEFDKLAQSIAGDEVTAYQLRKSALRLRKARQLRPELILRIADWGREIKKFNAAKIASDAQPVPENPGIYIFYDDTGYLYIGESNNLRSRLKKHLDESDSQSLAAYLKENGGKEIQIEVHSFAPDSQAKSKPIRRAYESELIESRKPRFNIAP